MTNVSYFYITTLFNLSLIKGKLQVYNIHAHLHVCTIVCAITPDVVSIKDV
jgi:hypothetical protein